MTRTQAFTATPQDLTMPCSVPASLVSAENLSGKSSSAFIGLGTIYAVWSRLNQRCDGGHISMLIAALAKKSLEDYSNQPEPTPYIRSGTRRYLAAMSR